MNSFFPFKEPPPSLIRDAVAKQNVRGVGGVTSKNDFQLGQPAGQRLRQKEVHRKRKERKRKGERQKMTSLSILIGEFHQNVQAVPEKKKQKKRFSQKKKNKNKQNAEV